MKFREPLKQGLAILLALFVAFSGIPFGGIEAEAAAKRPSIAKSASVKVGASKTLKISRAGYKIKSVKVKSSNKKVATVKASGKLAVKVTGKNIGTATITTTVKAKKNKKSKTFKLKTTVKVTGLSKTVTTAKQMNAALKNKNVTKVTIGTKTKSMSIPKGTYKNVDIVVNAPKASITNKARFKSITIKAIAANTWHENANGNNIKTDNTSGIRIVMEKGASLNNLKITRNSNGKVTVEVVDGSVKSINITGTQPVDIKASGEAKIDKIGVKAESEVSVETAGTSEVSKVEVSGAGATVDVKLSENSKVGEINVTKGASDADGNTTTVDVNAKGNSEVESVTTAADNSITRVVSDGNSSVSTVKVDGNAQAAVSGNSSKTTTIDVTGATGSKQVTVDKGTTRVEADNGSNASKVIDNNTGQNIPTTTTNPDGSTSTSTPVPPKTGGSSGSNSSGGSSGSSSHSETPSSTPVTQPVNVTGVKIEGTTPKVGDTISATLTPSDATNKGSYTTWKWESSKDKESWTTIGGNTSSYTLGKLDEGNYIRVTASGTGVTSYSAVTSEKVVASFAITIADTTNGTVSVAVNGKTVEGNILAAEDDNIKVTVTPAKGYQLATLTATTQGSGTTPSFTPIVSPTVNEYTFTMPDVGVDIAATFTAKSLTVKYDGNGGTPTQGQSGDEVTQVVAYSSEGASALPSNTFTNETAFLSWKTTVGQTTYTFSAGDSILEKAKEAIEAGLTEITLTAQWAPADATVSGIAWADTTNGGKATVDESKGTATISGNITVTWSNQTESTIAASAASWAFTSSARYKQSSDYNVSETTVTWSANDNKFISANDTVKFTGTYESKTVEFTLTVTDETAKYALTKASDTNGSFTLSVGEETKESGAKIAKDSIVTVIPSPSTGYKVAGVKYDRTELNHSEAAATPNQDGTYTFKMPEYETTVTVTFTESNYTVTLPQNLTGGTVTTAAETFAFNSTVTLTVTPADTYKLKTISATYGENQTVTLTGPTAGENNSSTYTFTMPAGDVTVSAEFEAKSSDTALKFKSETGNDGFAFSNDDKTITVPAATTAGGLMEKITANDTKAVSHVVSADTNTVTDKAGFESAAQLSANNSLTTGDKVLVMAEDETHFGTYTITVTAATPTQTTKPSFTATTAALGSTGAKSVYFTLSAAILDATWKVYDTETGTDESMKAEVKVLSSRLTLTGVNSGALASGTYYVTATVSPNTESERVALTVNPYVDPTTP